MSLALAAGVLLTLPTSASAAAGKEITKTVPATVVYMTHSVPVTAKGYEGYNDCVSVAVAQWKDPTEHRFVGSSWVAHFYFNGTERTVASTPPFDNEMTLINKKVYATGGNNWIRIETSSGTRGPDKGCSEFLAGQQAKYGSTAWVTITGQEDRTNPDACKKARKAYKKANKKVTEARKSVKNAKTPAAKARANAKLNRAKKARAQAAAASGRACSG